MVASKTQAQAPARSLDQRMEALKRANDIRVRRAQLKKDLKDGNVQIEGVLLDPPEYVSTAKVFDMLMAVQVRPGEGSAAAKWEPFVKINYAYHQGADVINQLTNEYATEHNIQNQPLEITSRASRVLSSRILTEEGPMPQQAWSNKRERQYEHIRESEQEQGRSTKRAKEIAARTVNKERARTRRGEGVVADIAARHLFGPARRPALRHEPAEGAHQGAALQRGQADEHLRAVADEQAAAAACRRPPQVSAWLCSGRDAGHA